MNLGADQQGERLVIQTVMRGNNQRGTEMLQRMGFMAFQVEFPDQNKRKKSFHTCWLVSSTLNNDRTSLLSSFFHPETEGL
jgi:hypothetical protein